MKAKPSSMVVHVEGSGTAEGGGTSNKMDGVGFVPGGTSDEEAGGKNAPGDGRNGGAEGMAAEADNTAIGIPSRVAVAG